MDLTSGGTVGNVRRDEGCYGDCCCVCKELGYLYSSRLRGEMMTEGSNGDVLHLSV